MDEDGPPAETLPDLPRLGGRVVGRAAELRSGEARQGGAGGTTAKNKPKVVTMAPWAGNPRGGATTTTTRQPRTTQHRRTAAPWAPPAPGKAGTSPKKASALPPPPPPQAFLDSCPGLSGKGRTSMDGDRSSQVGTRRFYFIFFWPGGEKRKNTKTRPNTTTIALPHHASPPDRACMCFDVRNPRIHPHAASSITTRHNRRASRDLGVGPRERASRRAHDVRDALLIQSSSRTRREPR